MKKITTAIILFAIPALVFAGPRKMMRNYPMPGKRMDMCEQLNLTVDQQEKMHDLRVAHQKAMVPVQADLKLAHLELEELIRDSDTSKKLDAAIKNVNSLKASQYEKQIKHRLAIGKILTDEQKVFWQRYHRGRGMGRRPGGRGAGVGMMGDYPRMPYWIDGPEADQD